MSETIKQEGDLTRPLRAKAERDRKGHPGVWLVRCPHCRAKLRESGVPAKPAPFSLATCPDCKGGFLVERDVPRRAATP